jgi:hypothetical protein
MTAEGRLYLFVAIDRLRSLSWSNSSKKQMLSGNFDPELAYTAVYRE